MNANIDPEQKALVTIERTVSQSRATELTEVTEYDGAGVLCPVQAHGEIVPVKPAGLSAEQENEIHGQAAEFIEMIRSDPNNWRIQGLIFNLGQEVVDGANVHVGLYEEKMGAVLKDVTGDSSPVTGDILATKAQLDLINPSVLSQQTITEKVGRIFKKTVKRLPKGDEILRTIAERRETVKSTVNGLKRQMNTHTDAIIKHSAELGVICDNLKELQPGLHAEIYKGQVIWKGLQDFYLAMDDGIEKENVSNLLADLATA
ncbi:MAG: tellurite resistance protein, partial [Desulfatitalea sp.]|nr:tellurite resistance protein [Desulfatitalea sp.]